MEAIHGTGKLKLDWPFDLLYALISSVVFFNCLKETGYSLVFLVWSNTPNLSMNSSHNSFNINSWTVLC